MANSSLSLAPGTLDTPLGEWELDTTITQSPTPIVDACGTNDGCAASCASSCASA
ncbi:FxLD family lantipeptide [Streptomyces sp. NPDC059534]|uniref:FxLD family lantipeptide n=1 Tax=Streptomyces sp. NPDC059534 TaxID=3346859 RepID=UPI00369B5AB7